MGPTLWSMWLVLNRQHKNYLNQCWSNLWPHFFITRFPWTLQNLVVVSLFSNNVQSKIIKWKVHNHICTWTIQSDTLLALAWEGEAHWAGNCKMDIPYIAWNMHKLVVLCFVVVTSWIHEWIFVICIPIDVSRFIHWHRAVFTLMQNLYH